MITRTELSHRNSGLGTLSGSLTSMHVILEHMEKKRGAPQPVVFAKYNALEQAIYRIDELRAVPTDLLISDAARRNWSYAVRRAWPRRAAESQALFNEGFQPHMLSLAQYAQTQHHLRTIEHVFAEGPLSCYEQDNFFTSYATDLLSIYPAEPSPLQTLLEGSKRALGRLVAEGGSIRRF